MMWTSFPLIAFWTGLIIRTTRRQDIQNASSSASRLSRLGLRKPSTQEAKSLP
jgi:hypothetical protein